MSALALIVVATAQLAPVGQAAPGGAQDPLAQLRGLQLPAEPSAWPPALGWWLVLAGVAVALMALGLCALWVRRRWSRGNPKLRAATARALDEIAARGDALSDAEFSAAVSAVMRRSALVIFGQHVAGIAGARWADFLRHHAPDSLRDSPTWALLSLARFRAPHRADSDAQIHPGDLGDLGDRGAVSRARVLSDCTQWVDAVARRTDIVSGVPPEISDDAAHQPSASRLDQLPC